MKFYSGTTNGFYDDAIHGTRSITVIDPEYIAPQVNQGEVVPTPDFIEIINPDCKIPLDAVEISDEAHIVLLSGQSLGKLIQAGEGGYPILISRPEPSANDLLKAQIETLESSVTERRLREAVLGVDGGWLANLEAQIDVLRGQL